ncbi:hypothetical protein [Paenibacillus albiflavus]|uniref:hypothetical protein n=1 Tax=Paenibacillus albiflavus TaxID=2545760 RepID=UPI001404738E|nr:hypothetical protein [Paenibacillus albiflavus]
MAEAITSLTDQLFFDQRSKPSCFALQIDSICNGELSLDGELRLGFFSGSKQ